MKLQRRGLSLGLAATLAALSLTACGGHPAQTAGGSVHPPGWGGTPHGFRSPPAAAVSPTVPTATMYDTTTLSTVPPNPFATAGYTAGYWITYPKLRATYPLAHTVSIAIAARFHADCLDVEPGDAVPSQAGPWAAADLLAGFARPCLYSDLAWMPAVKASLAASLGPSWRSQVYLWLAWYRFVPGLVVGYDAVQYNDRCLGLNLDCSTVSLPFLTIAQPPYVLPPKPTPTPAPTPPVQLCQALRARAGWFAAQLDHHPRAKALYRSRALLATELALSTQRCP